jgi:hypothetical protein
MYLENVIEANFRLMTFTFLRIQSSEIEDHVIYRTFTSISEKTAASAFRVEVGEAGKVVTGLKAGLALKGLFIEWLCTRAVYRIGIKARRNSRRWWEGSSRRESRWV